MSLIKKNAIVTQENKTYLNKNKVKEIGLVILQLKSVMNLPVIDFISHTWFVVTARSWLDVCNLTYYHWLTDS